MRVRVLFNRPIFSNAVHIDTVQISHAYRNTDLPPPNDLEKLNFDLNLKNRGQNKIMTAYSKPNKLNPHAPRLSIIISEHGYSGIKVEVSIAKLLDGIGLAVQTDEDIECALDAIEDYIRNRIGVNFDARTAKVKRYDANADFLVGEKRIQSYLKAISSPNARLITATFGTTTKQFHNKTRTLIVYSKYEEMKNAYKNGKVRLEDVKAAEGLLRVEQRIKNLQEVNRLAYQLSLPADSGHLFTTSVASTLVDKTLSELGLDNTIISYEKRDNLLIEKFGYDAALMLGTLEFRARRGERFWKELRWSQSTYYRKKAMLEKYNLWNISPSEELPALIIK
jgi:hypothetical protein